MQSKALSQRRLTSTLIISLLPLFLGITLYSYYLYHYFFNFNISPASGYIPKIGFGLLVITIPANFLAVLFLYISKKKNSLEIEKSDSLRNKIRFLFFSLGLNYAVAAAIIYNFNWINKTISIQLTNNYERTLREIRIVLPNGNGHYMLLIPPNSIGHARVFAGGEGPVELIITDLDKQKIRQTIIPHVSEGNGATVNARLTPEFSLEILSPPIK